MLGPPVRFVDRDYVVHAGRKLLYLGGIDYHRRSNDPEILNTLCDAARKYGISPTGSRTTTGNHVLYLELEREVARFFESAACAVFPSGYLSNIVLLQAVAADFDIFFLDAVAHSSLGDAARRFKKKMVFFNHLDAGDLDQKLLRHVKTGSRPLIMTDGIFPARGEIAPLEDYAALAEKYDGRILIDDAHAMAVVGKTGKGSWEEKGIDRTWVYQTGTLSKGFGIFGGIIPGDRSLISAIQEKSLAFIGATGLPLPLAAAAIQSVRQMITDRHIIPDLQERALALKDRFRRLGFDLPPSPAPIFSITHYDEAKNRRLGDILLANDIYPPFINYPGAPAGGHFRFILTSITTPAQVEQLFDAVRSSL